MLSDIHELDSNQCPPTPLPNKDRDSHFLVLFLAAHMGGCYDASCGQLRRKAMEEAQKGEDSQ